MHLLRVIVPYSTNLKHFHAEQNSSSSLQNTTKLSPEDAKGSCSVHPSIPNPSNSKLRESLRTCESSSCSSALLLEGRGELQAFPECAFLRDFPGIAHAPGWGREEPRDGEILGSSRTRAVLPASQGSALLRAGASHPEMSQELLSELFPCWRNPTRDSPQQGSVGTGWLIAVGSEQSFLHLKEHPSLPQHSPAGGDLCSPVWAAQSGGKSTEKRVFVKLLQFSLEQGGSAGLTAGLEDLRALFQL